jgi:hypothetical protein
MEVKHLTKLSKTLTENQIERLTWLSKYLEGERLLNSGNKKIHDICTNALAGVILIAEDE